MHFAPHRVHPTLSRKTALRALLAALGFALTAHAQSSSGSSSRRSSDAEGVSDGMPRVAERLPVFFPPNPPPLGRLASRGVPPGGRYPAPPELADYVSDFFYPALGTRLATRHLPDKLREQLEAYRAAKVALQDELRAELDRLRAVEPAARLEALAALSRRQTPGITELENTAEKLRRQLVTGMNNWSAARQWHLSSRHRRGYSPLEIAQVMRAYAFYDNHLLPAQRRLLREIAIELQFAADNTSAATAAQPFMFFPPEPARVLLPEALPTDVARQVATYQSRKSALKKELYDAVHAADGAAFGFLRGSLKALASKQAVRLKELDTLAEEIRRGLSRMPPARPPRSPLPAHLDSRVATLVSAYHSAQSEAVDKIEAILARAKELPMQATYRFDNENLRFLVVPTRRARGGGRSKNALPQIEAVRAEISAVADEYGHRIADMVNERDSIRNEAGDFLNLTKPDELDRTLFVAMRLANERQAESSFSEYRTAVFEPGLSPGQRRLLFDGVVERLELPLPRGDLQPGSRAETW